MSKKTEVLPPVLDGRGHVLFQTERGGAVYRMDKAKYLDLGADEKRLADEATERVCGEISVLYRTEKRDNGGTVYGLEVEFPTPDGSRIRTQVTRGELCTGNSTAIARLADLGLDVQMTSKNGTPPLAAYLYYYPAQTLPPLKLFDQGGWTDETFSRFLFKNATIQADGLPGAAGMDGGADGIDLNKRGTLAAWQAGVAARARHSRALQFALCIPFASVLSPLLETEVTVFHLYVKSGSGKTSAAIGAASIFGTGKPTAWDSSDNAMRIKAIAHNHVGLIMDELGQTNKKLLLEVAYMLGNGTDKPTAKRNRKMNVTRRFRFLGLSTGEASYSQIRRRVLDRAQSPATGELGRFISLYVGSGYGVLDSLPAGVTAGEFIDAFKDAASANTGHAGEAFVRAVIDDVQEFGADAFRTRMRSEAEKIAGLFPPESRKYGRIMKRFAAVAVAGELAIEAGVFGGEYKPGDMIDTVRHFVRVWLESPETEDGRLERLLEELAGLPQRYPREIKVYELDTVGRTLKPDAAQQLLRVLGQAVRDGGRGKRLLLIVLTSTQWTELLARMEGMSTDEAETALAGISVLLQPERREKNRNRYLWTVRRQIPGLSDLKRVLIFDVSDPDMREQARLAAECLTVRSRGG